MVKLQGKNKMPISFEIVSSKFTKYSVKKFRI